MAIEELLQDYRLHPDIVRDYIASRYEDHDLEAHIQFLEERLVFYARMQADIKTTKVGAKKLLRDLRAIRDGRKLKTAIRIVEKKGRMVAL